MGPHFALLLHAPDATYCSSRVKASHATIKSSAGHFLPAFGKSSINIDIIVVFFHFAHIDKFLINKNCRIIDHLVITDS